MDKQENRGCGCGQIPISLVLLILGGAGWWLFAQGNFHKIAKLLPPLSSKPQADAVRVAPVTAATPIALKPSIAPVATTAPASKPQPAIAAKPAPGSWEHKPVRGIYLSRFQITNNASESEIRRRVRYYRDRGFNTIVHGVWGNGCTMYDSQVMQQMMGAASCPNLFQARWLEWTIDEAHQQGMQVHAYFEKGIKIDKNSPIFERAIAKKWLVPGVDRTYAGVEHYVLDVEVPEVATMFRKMLAEFVTKYPQIDAVQWDDYLGYHAELPGKVDRTNSLTTFVSQLRADLKAANPKVSFELCHHNPYWAKRYFAADWQKWGIDRAFIQNYNEKNFGDELNYAVNYAGVAIADNQLHRLKELAANPKIKGILIFPLAGKPEQTADRVRSIDRAAAPAENREASPAKLDTSTSTK